MKHAPPRAERRRITRAALANEQLPAYTDLIWWVKLRARMSTRAARKLILAGQLKVDSHTVGIKTVQTLNGPLNILDRYIPAEQGHRVRMVTND